MDISAIIQALDAEIAKLEDVKRLLAGTSTAAAKRKPGRPAKATSFSFGGNAPASASKKRKHHTMSAEARARIAAAQKARWAKIRKAQKMA